MRILRVLTSPMGALGLTLLAFALALVALVLDQGDIKGPVLVYVFGILAGVTGLGALIAFFVAFFGAQADKLRAWIRKRWPLLWLVGGPLVFALLLGGMEWLISTSVYDALGIGAAAYALAQLGFVGWANRLARAEKQHEEVKQLRTQLTQAEQENEKKQRNLSRFNGDRLRFKRLLTDAWDEGTRLRESEPSDDEVQEWKAHMRDLLVAALGEGSRVDGVLKDDPTFESAVHGSTGEQKRMERSTNRLHDLIDWVKSPQAIPFRSGFDPHKWEDWKSPPEGASATPDDLRELERLRDERGKFETENQKLRKYESRWLLKLALNDAREEGLRLKESDPSDRDIGQWVHRIYKMLKEALPFYANSLDARLRRTLQRNPKSRFGFELNDDQVLDITLKYVEEIIRGLDSRDCPNPEPDFNGREWVSER